MAEGVLTRVQLTFRLMVGVPEDVPSQVTARPVWRCDVSFECGRLGVGFWLDRVSWADDEGVFWYCGARKLSRLVLGERAWESLSCGPVLWDEPGELVVGGLTLLRCCIGGGGGPPTGRLRPGGGGPLYLTPTGGRTVGVAWFENAVSLLLMDGGESALASGASGTDGGAVWLVSGPIVGCISLASLSFRAALSDISFDAMLLRLDVGACKGVTAAVMQAFRLRGCINTHEEGLHKADFEQPRSMAL